MVKTSRLNILITGGAGFIGSHIVEYLAPRVKKLRILDNLSSGNIHNIKYFVDKYRHLEFIYGDITDFETCIKACKGMDVVCHQAALVSVKKSIDDPYLNHTINENGTLNVLWAAHKMGVKRVVYASSAAVYGDYQKMPLKEENIGTQLSPYGLTKHSNELYAKMFHKLYGLETIGLRYFNVFGPRQNVQNSYAAVVPKFINQLMDNEAPTIFGSGNQTRDFTYVANIVQANLLAIITNSKKKEIFGKVYNVGSNENMSINALFKVIRNKIDTSIKDPNYGPKRKGEVEHSLADISAIKNSLNYEPVMSLPDAIQETIDYYQMIRENKNLEEHTINVLEDEKMDEEININED